VEVVFRHKLKEKKMNRRNILALLAGTMVFSCGLILASPKERPLKSSCKECKKCGRFCKCECSKGCKCKPGCCRRGESPILDPAFERPPQGRPNGRTPHRRYRHEIDAHVFSPIRTFRSRHVREMSQIELDLLHLRLNSR
jgi:hypothetical protein